MAIANWHTFAAAEVVTAANLNTYNRDNGRWLSGNATGGRPMCSVTKSGNQSIANATWDVMTFGTEHFDGAGMHSTISNTSRLTCPDGGDGAYICGGWCEWQTATDDNQRQMMLWLNATTDVMHVRHRVANDAGASVETAIAVCSMAQMSDNAASANDYIELRVYQDSGGALNVGTDSRFWAFWFSESQS